MRHSNGSWTMVLHKVSRQDLCKETDITRSINGRETDNTLTQIKDTELLMKLK